MPPRKIRDGTAKVCFFAKGSYVTQILSYDSSSFQAFSYLLDSPSEIRGLKHLSIQIRDAFILLNSQTKEVFGARMFRAKDLRASRA